MTESSSLVLLRSLQQRIRLLNKTIEENAEQLHQLTRALEAAANEVHVKDKHIKILKKELEASLLEFIDSISVEEIIPIRKRKKLDGNTSE